MPTDGERSSAALIAQIILDAIAVDGQLAQEHLVQRLAATRSGRGFATWARANPIPFEAMVRVLSATIRAYSRKARGAGMLKEALADQLLSLPLAVRRAMLASSGEWISPPPLQYQSEPLLTAVSPAAEWSAKEIDKFALEMATGILQLTSSLVGVILIVIRAVDLEARMSHEERLEFAEELASRFVLSLDTERAIEAMWRTFVAALGRPANSSERVAVTLARKKTTEILKTQRASFKERVREMVGSPEQLIGQDLTEDQFDGLTAAVERLTMRLREQPDELAALPPQTRDRLYELLANNTSNPRGRLLHTILFPVLTILEETAHVA